MPKPARLALQPLFGENLRRLLGADTGRSAAVARAAGVTARTLKRLSSGMHEPRPDTIDALLQALGVTGNELHPLLAGLRAPIRSRSCSHAELLALSKLACASCTHAMFWAMAHYAGLEHMGRGHGPNPSTTLDLKATIHLLQVLVPGLAEFNRARATALRFAVYGEELDASSEVAPEIDRVVGEHHGVEICRSAAAFARALKKTGHGAMFDACDGSVNAMNRVAFFSAALAFMEAGRPTVGAVFDPVRNELFYAVNGLKGRGQGYLWNLSAGAARPLSQSVGTDDLPVIAVHFSRQDAATRARFAKFVGALGNRYTIAALNSGQLALASVSARRISAFVNPKTKVWDCAAGEALINASGDARISTFGGAPIDYLADSVNTSVVAAATRELHQELLDAIAESGLAG